jgi:DNA-binding protein YbaB
MSGADRILAEAEDAYAVIRGFPRRIGAARLRGSAGNDSVVAHVDGAGRLLRVEVSETFCRHADERRLGEYLLVAIERAALAAEEFLADLPEELPEWVRAGSGRPRRPDPGPRASRDPNLIEEG